MMLHDPYIVWDTLRVLVAACGLWVAAVVFRITWWRWRDDKQNRNVDRPHPAMYASYGVCLCLTAFDRIENIGEPLNLPRMIVAWSVVGLAMYGLGRRYSFGYSLVRPGKRRRRTRKVR